jgi:hypothetical protein
MTVVDCKCFTSRIDVGDVEQFLGLLDDVNCPLGMMVTTVGYSKAALRRARGASTAFLAVVPLDEVRMWRRKPLTVSLTEGASYGSVIYFDGKDFVSKLVPSDLARRLLSGDDRARFTVAKAK